MSELHKILHVEDDLDIQEIAKLALEIVGGYEVAQCSNGPLALTTAPEFKPDLFLLDVMMPEMSGPETLTGLRALEGFKDTPVIFMTAKAQPDEILALREFGVIDIVTKPFDPMTLADQIRASWDKAKQS